MTLAVIDLGRVGYEEAERQLAAYAARRERALILGDHDPLYARGMRASGWPVRNDIPVIDVKRGGDVTYHGPGQLACRIAAPWSSGFTAATEEGVIAALADEGVRAHTIKEFPGVWVADRKIASLGFRVEDGWVAGGGIAINVTMDLTPFDGIVACGIQGVQMTSLTRETGTFGFPEFPGVVAMRVTEALESM